MDERNKQWNVCLVYSFNPWRNSFCYNLQALQKLHRQAKLKITLSHPEFLSWPHLFTFTKQRELTDAQKGFVRRWTEVKCFVLVIKMQRLFGRGLCACSYDLTDLLSSGEAEGRCGLHPVSAQHSHAFQIDICIVQPQVSLSETQTSQDSFTFKSVIHLETAMKSVNRIHVDNTNVINSGDDS
jgi:hypothetical protein